VNTTPVAPETLDTSFHRVCLPSTCNETRERLFTRFT